MTDDDEIIAELQSAFFPRPLAVAGPEFREVTVEQLARFFRNPCSYLLKERLGIELARGDEELQDEEPFVPDWSARRDLAGRVLPLLLEGRADASVAALARAGIEYPPGRLGELALARELELLGAFARGVLENCRERCLAPISDKLEILLDGQPWQLSGTFSDLRPAGLIRHRYDDVRATDYLNGWIAHLFVNAVAPAGVAAQTIWHSRDGHYTLPPRGDARERLAELLMLYRDGLQRPVHFFPKSAWAYARKGRIGEAHSKWRTSRFHHGEDQDPAYRLALRGVVDPLDAEFEHCALRVFAPPLNSISDPRLG